MAKEVTEAVRGHSPRGPKGYINPLGGLVGGADNSWPVLKRSSACCVVNTLSRGRSGGDEDQVAVAIIRKQVTVAWARVVTVDLYVESRACRIWGVRESNQSDLSDWVNVLHLLKWGKWG